MYSQTFSLLSFALIGLFAQGSFGAFWDNMPTTLSMYTNLPTGSNLTPLPCTRLVNKDGPIGCSSSRFGDTGALWPVYDQEGLDSAISSPPSHDFILVVASNLFTRSNVDQFAALKRIKGILVLPGPAPADGFSADSVNPQKQYGLRTDSEYHWNPLGSSFAFQDYRIPMFYLRENNDTDVIKQQATENKEKNGKFPQNAVWLHSDMHTSKTTEQCMRRGQCEPLGGKSVWATFGREVDSSKKIILAHAGYDSNAIFHDAAIGADSSISGSVGVVLAAQALKGVNMTSAAKQVIFALYTGESWGYIGSRKFIADIKNFSCKEEKDGVCKDPPTSSLAFTNIKFDNIDGVIELNQIGKLVANGNKLNLYPHKEKNQADGALRQALNTAASMADNGISIASVSTDTPGVPPSSSMSYLMENSNLETIVLAEHNDQYSNKYYHSRFDDYSNVNSSHICEVATLLARTLYAAAFEITDATKIPDSISVNCTLAEEIVQCLTQDMNCSLSNERYLMGYGIEPQPTQYTSVWRLNSVNTLTGPFLLGVLAEATAYEVSHGCINDADCDDSGHCIAGNCTFAAAYYHNALSLAFTADYNKDLVMENYNDNTSTWTESNWAEILVELFVMESPTTEIVVFVFGLIDLIASYGIVYGLRKYLTKRFKST